jgi:competence protein ComEA
MNPALREALSRVLARAVGSPLAKPIARVTLGAAGLVLLAFIGRTAVAGANGAVGAGASPLVTASSPTANPVAPAPSPASPATPTPTAAITEAPPSPRTQASPDDPVVLNTASVDDLRRLPGVGEKRANAILALRAHLGRFRAIEDLLKVKGIGRATLKRLRPLVRLDPPPSLDAGAAAPR